MAGPSTLVGRGALPEAARHAGPGTTLALYMGVAQAGRVADDLMSKGLPGASIARVAANVSKPSERHLECPLAELPSQLAAHDIKGCATIVITWPERVEAIALSA